ncbi:hypothetical protein Pint_12092 [Pistacia integerrima]|uniref:Uncharacterized protein n=1 Tax=Pistacia integerrima TaxID=434235 RepID=A0ACC0XG24_9ROSI|nr:hypothetical protein Pint_12092 [Pistacia integerrima]
MPTLIISDPWCNIALALHPFHLGAKRGQST